MIDLQDDARNELVELAGIINAARDRSLDEEACRPCRWLIELPMTDAEASRFRDILSKNRVAEPSNVPNSATGDRGASPAKADGKA